VPIAALHRPTRRCSAPGHGDRALRADGLADVVMVLMIRRSLRRSSEARRARPGGGAGAIRLTFDHVTASSVLATGAVSIVC